MWTNRSRLSFSNKLFIFCSVSCILFPVVASINQGYRPSFLLATPCHSPAPPTKTLADDFTSKLSLLDCNLRLRIYEHVAGLRRVAVSKKKQVRNLVGFLQGLAIIVFYALSFVVSIIALLVLLVTVCSTNPSSSHSPCTVSLISDMSELKNNAVVMFVVIMLMFQSVVFRCAMGKNFTPASIRVTKRRIKNLLHKRLLLLSTSFRVYRLRNVVHNMLLLLSGDVELNPGPNGKKIGSNENGGPADGITGNSYEKSTDAGYESFSVPPSAVSLPPPYFPPSLSPLPTPSVATNTNHSTTLESVPSTNSTINTLSEAGIQKKHLPSHLSASIEPASRSSTSQLNLLSTSQVHLEQPADTSRNLEASGLETESGKTFSHDKYRNSPPVRHKKNTTVIADQNSRSIPMRKCRSDEYKQYYGIEHVPTSKEKLYFERRRSFQYNKLRPLSQELTADDIARDGFGNAQTKKREGGTDKVEVYTVYAEKLGDRMGEFINGLDGTVWTSTGGFKGDTLDEPQFRFYLLANQLVRYRGSCPLCLICGKLKQEAASNGPPRCHIFPRSTLLTYIDIHGDSAKSECVYDSSTPEDGIITAKKLTAPLFCTSCESSASFGEKLLRDLYLDIMDPKYQMSSIQVKHPEWLRHVLVTIMFRGMLLINFLSEIQNDFDQFMKILIVLRNYVKNKYKYNTCSQNDIPEEISENFGLFVLPDGHFVVGNGTPVYLFDLSLRCPRQTSIVREFGRTFLYTHFDCFHCVLPIDGKPETAGLDLTRNCLHSKFIYSYIPSKSGEEKYDYIHIPSSPERKRVFPVLLVDVNIQKAVKLGIEILTSPGSNCDVFINRFPEKLPTPPLKWHDFQIGPVDGSLHLFKPISEESREEREKTVKERCKEAAEYSPLREAVAQRKVSNSNSSGTAAQNDDSAISKSKDEQITELTQSLAELQFKNRGRRAEEIERGTLKNVEFKRLKTENKELLRQNEKLHRQNEQLKSDRELEQPQGASMGGETPQNDLVEDYPPPIKQSR